jgi:hypothetical protein
MLASLSLSLALALLALAPPSSASASSCTPRHGNRGVNQEVTAPDLFLAQLRVQSSDGVSARVSDTVVLQVNRSWSPIGADHFYALLLDGYYSCAAFTYINASRAYAQLSYSATAEYNSKWDVYIKDDDATVARHSNTDYTVSFVPEDGFGTRSTAIMINLNDNSYLDAMGYYPFAEVVSGFNALVDFTSEDFTISDEDAYKEGGNTWLWTEYDESQVKLVSSFTVSGTSSSSGSPDRSGSWAFSVIMVLLSSAACVYAGLYIVRYVRKQQGYDTMADDSQTGSSDRIISLNLQEA